MSIHTTTVKTAMTNCISIYHSFHIKEHIVLIHTAVATSLPTEITKAFTNSVVLPKSQNPLQTLWQQLNGPKSQKSVCPGQYFKIQQYPQPLNQPNNDNGYSIKTRTS